MAMQFNPYLAFSGHAREAMEFYQSVLGGELQVTAFRDTGFDADGVMHSSLDTPAGFHLFASDHLPGMGPDLVQGNDVQLSLSGDDDAALRGYWDKLSDAATVTIPLQKQMWGDEYGQLIDKFGITWHVNIAGSHA